MIAIIGFGNSLRAEDAFGIDVIKELKKYELKKYKLISCLQLTPELCLELLNIKKIIFIDSCHNEDFSYKLACSMIETTKCTLSHHISPQVLVSMLKEIYKQNIEYEIFSMTSKNYDKIEKIQDYKVCIKKTCEFLKNN